MLLQKRMFVFVYSLLEYERLTVLNFLLNSSTCKCSGKLCHLWELIIFDNFKEDFIWPIGGVVIIEYSKTIFSWRWQSDRVSQMNRNSQETEIVTFNVKNPWIKCKFIYQPLHPKRLSFQIAELHTLFKSIDYIRFSWTEWIHDETNNHKFYSVFSFLLDIIVG